MKRVGFLTSGGDCQALNATMRGVAKGLYQIYKDEVEIIGFEDGYKGLMYANSQIFQVSSQKAERCSVPPDSRSS